MDALNKKNKPVTGNILNDIQISKGAIVSKTLVKSGDGNSSIFAIDKGQVISKHKAAYEVIVYCFEGEINFSVSEETFKLTTGQWLTVPSNLPHGLVCIKPAKIMITMFKSENIKIKKNGFK